MTLKRNSKANDWIHFVRYRHIGAHNMHVAESAPNPLKMGLLLLARAIKTSKTVGLVVNLQAKRPLTMRG